MRTRNWEPGIRVWAILESDKHTVRAFGWGTYLGDFRNPALSVPDDLLEGTIHKGDAGFDAMIEGWVASSKANPDAPLAFTEEDAARARARHLVELARPMPERVAALQEEASANPKIALDSGGFVWGAECWWGPATEDDVLQQVGSRTLIMVPAPHDDEDA